MEGLVYDTDNEDPESGTVKPGAEPALSFTFVWGLYLSPESLDFYNSIFQELKLHLSKINKRLSKMFVLST